jgi:uncharacterized phiE125 gp8 family phage protein
MSWGACGCEGGWPGWGDPSWRAAVPNKSVLVVPPAEEPLTLAEAKLRAGLDWPSPDAARDKQMESFIRAARERVERDTGIAMFTQTRDVYLSHLVQPANFPAPHMPLQSVEAITGYDTAGAAHVLATPGAWALVNGRLTWAVPNDWPLGPADVYPWVVRIVVGYDAVDKIPPLLLFAVGLLTAHYATAARDAVVVGTSAQEMPLGYEDAIADYRRVAV